MDGRSAASTGLLVIGFVAQLLVGFVHLAGGLVVPFPWLPILWLVWSGFTVLAVLQRRRPAIVVAVPVASLAFFVLAVTLGERLLGWQA